MGGLSYVDLVGEPAHSVLQFPEVLCWVDEPAPSEYPCFSHCLTFLGTSAFSVYSSIMHLSSCAVFLITSSPACVLLVTSAVLTLTLLVGSSVLYFAFFNAFGDHRLNASCSSSSLHSISVFSLCSCLFSDVLFSELVTCQCLSLLFLRSASKASIIIFCCGEACACECPHASPLLHVLFVA